MSGERSAEEIQRDIEKSRAELARTVDQLAYRTSPKRLTESARTTLRDKAKSPAGQAVLGTSAVLVVVLVVRRVRTAQANKRSKARPGRKRR